jgi:hypothetical protein
MMSPSGGVLAVEDVEGAFAEREDMGEPSGRDCCESGVGFWVRRRSWTCCSSAWIRLQ